MRTPSRRAALRTQLLSLREEASPHLCRADADRMASRTRAALEALGPRPLALSA